jgi:hypothetical protein
MFSHDSWASSTTSRPCLACRRRSLPSIILRCVTLDVRNKPAPPLFSLRPDRIWTFDAARLRIVPELAQRHSATLSESPSCCRALLIAARLPSRANLAVDTVRVHLETIYMLSPSLPRLTRHSSSLEATAPVRARACSHPGGGSQSALDRPRSTCAGDRRPRASGRASRGRQSPSTARCERRRDERVVSAGPAARWKWKGETHAVGLAPHAEDVFAGADDALDTLRVEQLPSGRAEPVGMRVACRPSVAGVNPLSNPHAKLRR